MKNFVTRALTGLLTVYLFLNGLVFFGQDLTVRKTPGGSWCVTLADHSQGGLFPSESPAFLNNSRRHHTHKHQSDGIHICVQNHKVLSASHSRAFDGAHLLKASFLSADADGQSVSIGHSQFPIFLKGQDPDPPLPQPGTGTILRL